jgi:hypothetical protein
MADPPFDATTVSELDGKFSDFGQKLQSQENLFPKADPRAERTRELRIRIQAWRKDLDSLAVIWSRWRANCATVLEVYRETSSGNVISPQQMERLQELKKQFDADIPAFYYFSEAFLDRVAESVGFLLGDKDLNSHDRLQARGIVPHALQQAANRLSEHIAEYRGAKTTEDEEHFHSSDGLDKTGKLDRPFHLESPDLTVALKLLQTYAFGMMEFLGGLIDEPLPQEKDKDKHEPVPKDKRVEAFRRAPKRVPLMLGGGLVAFMAILILVVPSWSCLPSILNDLQVSDELAPPLPGNCLFTSEEASEETIRSLEKRREDRELDLQRRVTCKMLGRAQDAKWLDNFYSEKTLQYGRHVFIAETQVLPSGGMLFVVDVCLVPRWKYLKRLAGHCDAEL